MAMILQLTKQLSLRPQLSCLQCVTLTQFTKSDVECWLDLRDLCFADEPVRVRKWTYDDVVTEFFHRWWWNPDRMWLARDEAQRLIGSVTLAMRGEPGSAKPVAHWLMVSPPWRRRGIGRLLMAHLEAAVWDTGYREISLETHGAWKAAGRFYETLGYRPNDIS